MTYNPKEVKNDLEQYIKGIDEGLNKLEKKIKKMKEKYDDYVANPDKLDDILENQEQEIRDK